MNDIVLVGFGGHAKSIVDSIEKGNCYHIVGYTDIHFKEEYKDYKYLGNDEVLPLYYKKGVRYAFVSIGYMGKERVRDSLYEKVKEIGFQIPTIIDSTAILANDVIVGEGTFIGKACVINSSSRVGNMCIINTGSILEHENQIGDFTHVSVNSTLCGNVSVGDHCFIGANSTIIQDVRIRSESIIGAGSIILRDILPKEKVVGIVKGFRGE